MAEWLDWWKVLLPVPLLLISLHVLRRRPSPPEQVKMESEGTPAPLANKSTYYYAHNTVSPEGPKVSPEGPKVLVGAQEIYNHKPLDTAAVKALERENSSQEELGSSAWNKGGTWEEKDFSKWAEGRIKDLFPEIESPNKVITFSSPSTVDECHATVVISRGKKKPLCEVEKIKVPWRSAEGESKGKMEITDVSTTSISEMSISFSFDKTVDAPQKAALERELSACQKPIETMFETLVAEMMAK